MRQPTPAETQEHINKPIPPAYQVYTRCGFRKNRPAKCRCQSHQYQSPSPILTHDSERAIHCIGSEQHTYSRILKETNPLLHFFQGPRTQSVGKITLRQISCASGIPVGARARLDLSLPLCQDGYKNHDPIYFLPRCSRPPIVPKPTT